MTVDFIKQLQVFVTVVEARSFTGASEMLHMGRPAVTKAINELEKNVGSRLLQRTTRRISLTGEGEAFYERAQPLLNDIEETQNLFGGTKEKPNGRLRIDIPVSLAQSLVIPHMDEFRLKYPDVSVILGVSDQPVDLIQNSVDCVLRIGALPISSMVGRKIATLPMVTCASPTFLAKYGKPRTVEDLADYSVINYFTGQIGNQILWYFNENGKEISVSIKSPLMTNEATSLVNCALNDMGIVQVPGILIEEHLANGKLKPIFPKELEITFPLSIMYPNRQYLAPQVRLFIDWIIELVRDNEREWLQKS